MGFKLSAILFVILGIMSAGFVWYYNDTQERLTIMAENNAKLEIAVQTNEDTIKSLESSYAAIQQENARINEAYADIRRQNARLSDKLADMDLGLLAAEKPDSIERAVNRGTANAGRCFELLSGAPLTEEEKNATDGESFNKECPWLFDTYQSRGLLNNTPTAD
jgi:hypothetical protein